jgi:hypothetical protein
MGANIQARAKLPGSPVARLFQDVPKLFGDSVDVGERLSSGLQIEHRAVHGVMKDLLRRLILASQGRGPPHQFVGNVSRKKAPTRGGWAEAASMVLATEVLWLSANRPAPIRSTGLFRSGDRVCFSRHSAAGTAARPG